MKNDALEKIHKFGKISYIISKIAMIISVILMIIVFIIILFFSLIPRGLFTTSTSSQTVFAVDMTGIADNLQADFEEVTKEKYFEGQKFSIMENDYEYELVDIRQEGNIIKLVGESEPAVFEYQNVALMGFTIEVWMVLEMIILHFVKKLCRMFCVCETPFAQDMIDILQKLSISLIPMAVFSVFGNSILNSIKNGKIDFSIDLEVLYVLPILLVFMLTFIFKYGAMLQQESDETL